VPRVHFLPYVVQRIVAVLADEDNSVDREFVAAEREGFADGGIDAKAIPGREIAALVVGRRLVREKRDHVIERRRPYAICGVAGHKAPDENVGVGVIAIFRDDRGDLFLAGSVGWWWRRGCRGVHRGR